MPRYPLLLAALVLLHPGSAAAAPDPVAACEQAASLAEQAHGVPAGLLAAIGRIETGRRDPADGRLHPWPWTVDVDGAGATLPTSEAAVAAVLRAQSQGQVNIDVGCFQVNLLAHPQAFATLQEAFDPARNADYAARFLDALHQRTGSWPVAVMAYHSATPGLGEPYRDRVLASWTGNAGSPPRSSTWPQVSVPGLQIWTPAAAGSASSHLMLAPPITAGPTIIYLKN